MEFTQLGVIANTHGLKGMLKVKSETDFKDIRYKVGSELYIKFRDEMIKVIVKSFAMQKGLDYLTFEGLEDINLVEKYKGSFIYCDASIQPKLDKEEYYYNDLLGLEVHDQKLIGLVKEVREYPQGEMLVVSRENMKDALIPFRKEFIKEVDLKSKRITIYEIEGLLWE